MSWHTHGEQNAPTLAHRRRVLKTCEKYNYCKVIEGRNFDRKFNPLTDLPSTRSEGMPLGEPQTTSELKPQRGSTNPQVDSPQQNDKSIRLGAASSSLGQHPRR